MKHSWLILIIITGVIILPACSKSDSDFDLQNAVGANPMKSLIEISSPTNGDVLPKNTPFILEYAVVRGKRGDYVKIRVDEQKPITVTGTKGQHHFDGLPAGKHRITITEYTNDRKMTGGQVTITITMQ